MALRVSNTVRTSILVRIASYEGISLNKRTIMSSLPRMEKALETLKKNPYYEKYAKNIAKLQQTSPEEFLSRVEQREQKLKEEKEKRKKDDQFAKECKAKAALGNDGSETKKKVLSDIMKMDLIEDKGKQEIIEIWVNYHKKKDCISGAMSKEQFEKMFERAQKYSTFLLPLPRENGYEFIVTQFSGTEIHMTPLIWYQTHKENAPECLTITHYTEFKDSKDVVLMRGEFDKNSLKVQEAQCLVNELQLYYASDDPARLDLLKSFTEKPDNFKHMDLIVQLESISLDNPLSASSTPKESKS